MAKVKFSDFIDAVLEPLSTVSSAAAGTDVGQFLRVWLRRSINEGIPLFTWLSLLLPEVNVCDLT
jgi:hypothetical protein